MTKFIEECRVEAAKEEEHCKQRAEREFVAYVRRCTKRAMLRGSSSMLLDVEAAVDSNSSRIDVKFLPNDKRLKILDHLFDGAVESYNDPSIKGYYTVSW